ncbi:MAG: ATP-binding cassette domain-containing protein [Rhodothermia bacterium]|nr:ATP-binding cassette domain-containing protein [Rhodothermia bacterium]
MIELKQVSKSFDGHRALANLSLRIEEAKTTVLIGQSGCGKSTALRIMIGLIEADEGEVVILGEKLSPANVLSVRRRVGYVIQDGGLFPHLTARENVTLMARHLRWPDDLIRARLFTLSELVQLRLDRLDLFPVELSGGQQQRIGLMRALFLDPDVLLMDEPLGALDPMIRAGLQDELRDIFRELDKTVVLVTHDLAEAAFLGDHIALLREGRLVQLGTIADLTDTPADEFVTEFVGAQRHLSLLAGGE